MSADRRLTVAATVPIRLTPRERQVVALLREGYRAGEIADQLGVSIHTVRAHLASAQARADARTLPHLIAMLVKAEEPTDRT